MTDKYFLEFPVTLFVALTGIALIAADSYEESLVTSPNRNSFSIPAGQPFNITCKGSGDDAKKFSSLKWLNKDGKIIEEGIPGTQEEQKYSLTLTFTDPKEDDSGVYKCMAAYQSKHVLQKSVSIIFHGDKPVFDVSFRNVTATENLYVEIYCAAVGEAPITYEWYNQDEEKITDDSKLSIYKSDIENASLLIIPKPTSKHSGMYTCLATNSHGATSKIYELTVLADDGNDTTDDTISIQGFSVVSMTATSFKFTVNVTGPVEYIDVRYRKVGSHAGFTRFDIGDVYEMKRLTPAAKYVFNFRTDPSEDYEWTEDYHVVLLPETPEVIFQTIDSGTIKLEWLFKFEDKEKKTIDRHEITYFSVQMEGGTKWKPSSCNITIQIPECRGSAYTLSGLQQNVYYEIQLRAHTESGFSEPYRQKVFMRA